jgi:hypothetical protein
VRRRSTHPVRRCGTPGQASGGGPGPGTSRGAGRGVPPGAVRLAGPFSMQRTVLHRHGSVRPPGSTLPRVPHSGVRGCRRGGLLSDGSFVTVTAAMCEKSTRPRHRRPPAFPDCTRNRSQSVDGTGHARQRPLQQPPTPKGGSREIRRRSATIPSVASTVREAVPCRHARPGRPSLGPPGPEHGQHLSGRG